MKQLMSLVVAFTLALTQVSSVAAQVQDGRAITGTVTGPGGALAGVTVQAIDVTGTVAGTAVTTGAGAFSISGLRPGTFTVQVLGSSGQIIAASSVTLTAETMTATVKIEATAGTLAIPAAKVAAGGPAARGVSAWMVLAGVGAAAAALVPLAVIATNGDVSGSR